MKKYVVSVEVYNAESRETKYEDIGVFTNYMNASMFRDVYESYYKRRPVIKEYTINETSVMK